MPTQKGFWQFHNGVWVGILGEDVLPPEPPPPPPPTGVGPPPTYVAAGGGKGSSNAVLPNWPAGHAVGQVGLLVVQTAAQAVGNLMALLALGWAHAPGSPLMQGTAGAAGSVGLTVLWKRAGTTAEPAPDVGDSGNHQIARILLFDGAFPTGSPFDATGDAANTLASASTAVSIPAATTTSDNCRIVAIVANATDTTVIQGGTPANGSLTDVVGIANYQHDAGVGGGFNMTTGVKATAGLYGATTQTLLTASAQARMSLAFRPIVGVAPPPTGSFRTMLASQSLIASRWGTTPTPDNFQVMTVGSTIVGAGGWLDDAATAGSCMICRITGGNDQSKNPDGSFSPTMWENQFTDWKQEVEAVTGGVAKLRAAVADGRWRALYTLDDFVSGGPQTVPPPNQYLHAVTFEEIEQICAFVKSFWPWMPLVARGPNSYLRAAAAAPGAGDRINGVRQYHYLDAGWGQVRPKFDPNATTYVNKQVNDGLACALGFVGGCNMLDQGAGTTPGWGCQEGGVSGKCGMSPTEIRDFGTAMLANPNVHGFNYYSYGFGPTYWGLPEIQAAMLDVYNASVGRTDGPINVRGDLTPA